MESIRPLTERQLPDSGVFCIALAHNEAPRVEDFLRHHRALGVKHFLIVDDGSSDGTTELLKALADVTLFMPQGTNYKDHKVLWRKDILDRYAPGRWVLVPDLDELFVYPHCDTQSISSLSAYLDREGSEALFAPMVEMYADAPLDQPVYKPGESMLAGYPYFDGDGYRLVQASARHLKRYPTPPLNMHGGARERLFYSFAPRALKWPFGWVLKRFAHERRSMNPGLLERAGNTFARFVLRRKMPQPPLIMSKLALVKWRVGLRFAGGPHSISERLLLSEVWGALLHFKFMDLSGEAAYGVARGQHIKGATHYKLLLAKGGFDRSPMYEGSRKYQSWHDLLDCGLLRSSELWETDAHGPRQTTG